MESIGTPVNMPLPNIAAEMHAGKPTSIEQIKQVGEDFESVFLSMMLKEMRNSLEEGFFGGEGSDSFGGMFDMFIGQHLAKSGPIGVADMMVQQYAKGNSKVPDGENGDDAAKVSFSA